MNERTNLQAIFQSEMSTTVKTLSRNKLTLVYAKFGWFLIFQTLNKDCCFVCFILRQMISRCRVCAVTSAVKAWFSHENIFGFDIPSEACKRYYASRRLCWTLIRRILFPSFHYNELVNIEKVERYRLFNSWKVSSNSNKYYQASLIS